MLTITLVQELYIGSTGFMHTAATRLAISKSKEVPEVLQENMVNKMTSVYWDNDNSKEIFRARPKAQ